MEMINRWTANKNIARVNVQETENSSVIISRRITTHTSRVLEKAEKYTAIEIKLLA